MLSFSVYAKLQPRTDHPSAHTRRPTISPFLIHPLCFQTLPHSFAQWATPISFSFNRFHTLSIVMGGGGRCIFRALRAARGGGYPAFKNLNHYFKVSSSPLAASIRQNNPRPFFSTTYKLPIFYPLCFDIHACNGGVGRGSPMEFLKEYFNYCAISAETTSLPRRLPRMQRQLSGARHRTRARQRQQGPQDTGHASSCHPERTGLD